MIASNELIAKILFSLKVSHLLLLLIKNNKTFSYKKTKFIILLSKQI